MAPKFSVLLTPTYSLAANQTQIGTGNQIAIRLSQNSPLIQSAFANLNKQVSQIRDRTLRTATLDAISNSKTCVQHRIGVTTLKTKLLEN